MLKPLLSKLLGLLIAPVVVFGVVLRIVTKGWGSVFASKPRPLPPKTVNDPRWGQHNYIRIDDLLVHYVEKGDRQKPLMVFLHGFPEFWYSWRYQIEHFAEDFWCVAPDGRGYGDTDKPTGIDQYDVDKLARDVKNLVHALGRSECILFGHDWGGMVGYQVIDRHPEVVRAYVACNTAHGQAFAQAMEGGFAQKIKSWYMFFFQCPVIPETVYKLSDTGIFNALAKDFNNKDMMNEEDIEAYKFAFRDSNAFKAPIDYYRALFQRNPRPQGKVPASIPVLNIFGTGDKYITLETTQLSRGFCADYTERLLEGVSHWVTMDAHQETNRIVRQFIQAKGLN